MPLADAKDVGDLSSCVGSDCMGAYDTVVTVYTLRNFSDATQANEQMLAALKPGGTLILLDAFPPEEGDVIGRILTALLRVRSTPAPHSPLPSETSHPIPPMGIRRLPMPSAPLDYTPPPNPPHPTPSSRGCGGARPLIVRTGARLTPAAPCCRRCGSAAWCP